MQRWISVLGLCAALLAQMSQAASVGTASQADAATLISNAQRAIGQLVGSAEADKTLSNKTGKAKPFWDGLKTAHESLDRASTSAKVAGE